MSDVRVLVVGTYASVNAWANDQGWKAGEDYYVITSARELREVADAPIEKVFVTYGWREMPSSRALEIADFLIAAGFDRKKWSYV